MDRAKFNHKVTSIAVVLLLTTMLFPIGNAEDVRVGEQQKSDLEAAFGEGAPFGAVGKMLEEVDFYFHSPAQTLGPDGWVTPAANSVAGGDDPASYSQLPEATADFKKPTAAKKSYIVVGSDPSGFFSPPALETFTIDDPADPNNKRVRIGVIDPEAAGAEPGVGEATVSPAAGPTPAPYFNNFDSAEQVFFTTPADLTTDADLRIYDIKATLFAQCTNPDNDPFGASAGNLPSVQFTAEPIEYRVPGNLVVEVFRLNADGTFVRGEDGNVLDPIRSISTAYYGTSWDYAQSEDSSYLWSADLSPVGAYTGSFLNPPTRSQLEASGSVFSPPETPNFFLDEGVLVKQGERLGFRVSADGIMKAEFDKNSGEAIIIGENSPDQTREYMANGNLECFLHYDTKRDRDAEYLDIEYVDPAASGSLIENPGYGYDSGVSIIADSLRVSTWISDSNGRLAVGLGDGDNFNVDTAYMSAWGSLARSDNYADQPHALDKRVSSQFRYSDTQEIIDDFISTGSSTIPVSSTSILATRDGYTFSPGTKRIAPFNTELFVDEVTMNNDDDDDDNPLALRSQNFEGVKIAQSASVFIGKTGMNFFLATDETSTHLVNPGESTVFTYTVENLGSSTDTITIAMDPIGGGWTGQIIGSQQVVGGGGSASIPVLITPPPGATAGTTSPDIKVRAISSFADIIPPQNAAAAKVTITDTVTRGIALSASASSVNLPPGESRFVGLNLRNLGTAQDNFIVRYTVPEEAAAWNIKLVPTGRSILAGARGDFQLSIEAPADAPANFEFPITITANRVGDAAVSKTLSVAAKVVGAYELAATPLPPSKMLDLRQHGGEVEEGPASGRVDPRGLNPDGGDFATGTAADDQLNQERYQCFGLPKQAAEPPGGAPPAPSQTTCLPTNQDVEYSDSVIFPILVENKGSLADTYVIERTPTTLSGWQYRFVEQGSPLSSATYTDSKNTPISIDVPAGSSKYVYLEMDPKASGTTPESTFVSTALTVTMASKGQNGLKSGAMEFKVDAVPAGEQKSKLSWTGESHGVALYKSVGTTGAKSVLPAADATYTIRAQNIGNERDTLVIRASQLPAGWTQSFSFVSAPLATCTDATPAGGLPTMRCEGVKVGEDVVLNFTVKPGATILPGEFAKSVVSVTSQSRGSATDALDFTTTATGTHVFQANELATNLKVYRGQSTLFPFSIANTGTSGDDYAISIVSGNPAYKARLSVAEELFIPSGHTATGFLAVTAPSNAALGTPEPFTVQVESLGGSQLGKLDFFATPTGASNLVMKGEPSESFLISERGAKTPFSVKATDLTGVVGKKVTVTINPASLPAGWTVEPLSKTGTLASAGGVVSTVVSFNVTAPLDALGNSRLPVRFTGSTDHASPLSGFADVVFDTASTSGLDILTPLGATRTVTAGSEEVYTIQVRNNGLGNDLVNMSASGVPAGWTVTFNPPQISLGPLETGLVNVHVKAPIGASPKSAAPILVFATGASGALAQQTLTTTIGFYELVVTTSDATAIGAPAETLSHIITVQNNGSVQDTFLISAVVASADYVDATTVAVEPATVSALAPGESKDVRVTLKAKQAIPAGVVIPMDITATSVGNPALVETVSVDSRMLDFKLRDADGDGIQELTVDRDEDSENGFEQFKEITTNSGKQSSSIDVRRFFTDAAAAEYTVQRVLDDGNTTDFVDYILDGDEDGRVDHFVDNNGDLLPDYYWDPDSGKVSQTNVRRDTNADDIPEIFVDLNADGELDAVFDLTNGKWTPLLVRDLDGDGVKDYIVDKNKNGRADANETILYSKNGKLLSVQKVDMDGDGTLDEVYDLDGDGRPDQWIPSGKTTAIAITLRDYNNDGVDDWGYDADGDGTNDSYYNPVDGEVAMIDSDALFFENLLEYWYVGAIFLVVVGLFVVLLVVTRR